MPLVSQSLSAVSTCEAPSPDNLQVPGAFPTLSVIATGTVTYSCARGRLTPAPASDFADLRSDDGQWVGRMYFAEIGLEGFVPAWELLFSATGEQVTYFAAAHPQASLPVDEASSLPWTRTAIRDHASNTLRQGPRPWFVIRTETADAGLPSDADCANSDGDGEDFVTGFTARYTFVSCDEHAVEADAGKIEFRLSTRPSTKAATMIPTPYGALARPVGTRPKPTGSVPPSLRLKVDAMARSSAGGGRGGGGAAEGAGVVQRPSVSRKMMPSLMRPL